VLSPASSAAAVPLRYSSSLFLRIHRMSDNVEFSEFSDNQINRIPSPTIIQLIFSAAPPRPVTRRISEVNVEYDTN
jgi:hypothetical protein